MRVARWYTGLVLVVLLAAQCSSSTPAAAPDSAAAGSQSSADTRAASEAPADDNGSTSSDLETDAVAAARTNVPAGVPDGFPYDCRDESLRLIWTVSYEDRAQGIDDRGEILWENTSFSRVTEDPLHPQTEDYYVDERGLIDRETGDELEEYDGGFEFVQFDDCSVAFEGQPAVRLRRLAPNGFTMWEAPGHQGTQFDYRGLTGITPSTVVTVAAHDNDTSEVFDANDGSMLWTSTFEDNDLRPLQGHDIIVHKDGSENLYSYLDARTGETIFVLSNGGGTVCGNILWWQWRTGGAGTGTSWFDVRTGEELGVDPSISSIVFFTRGNAAGTGGAIVRDDGVAILPDCGDPSTEIPTEIARAERASSTDHAVAIDHAGGTTFVDPESGTMLFESEPLARLAGATESAFFLQADSRVTLHDDRTGDVLATFENAELVRPIEVPPHIAAPIVSVFDPSGGFLPFDTATGEPFTIN